MCKSVLRSMQKDVDFECLIMFKYNAGYLQRAYCRGSRLRKSPCVLRRERQKDTPSYNYSTFLLYIYYIYIINISIIYIIIYV